METHLSNEITGDSVPNTCRDRIGYQFV